MGMDKKYAVQGIIGCALFGVGDWLLGSVYPYSISDLSCSDDRSYYRDRKRKDKA